MAGYSGTALETTLGVRAVDLVLLDGAWALDHGRVDVKVCAVDDVWSGLKHVIRRADR
ncbi:hypothetical protein GCM10009682_07050 [Luedemannella flava]|uniref:Uncharacterized protein n=1 Tax=Luedemannella flava TaxID=349316 RepID=A0ABP4XT44_9ACTN